MAGKIDSIVFKLTFFTAFLCAVACGALGWLACDRAGRIVREQARTWLSTIAAAHEALLVSYLRDHTDVVDLLSGNEELRGLLRARLDGKVDEASFRSDVRRILNAEQQQAAGIQALLVADGAGRIIAATRDFYLGQGLELVRRDRPRLVVLDILLPDMDGLDVCRKLKWDEATRALPIVMVTAKADESDVVLGLGLGADDYVCKPFRLKELVARVKAAFRRAYPMDPPQASMLLAHGLLVIDVERREVLLDGRPVTLTPTELRLLHAMVIRPGRILSRTELIALISPQSAEVTERTVDVHVQSVRRKLGIHRDLIGTIRGVGYRFDS